MNAYMGVVGVKTRSYVELVTDIVSAYVSNNLVPPAEVPSMLTAAHAALAGLDRSGTARKPSPASIRKSVTREALISFENGKPYKTLKRHLTAFGLTPHSYRQKWGLPWEYPMAAASHTARCSASARGPVLGPKRRTAPPRLFLVTPTIPDTPGRYGMTRTFAAGDPVCLAERDAAK